jgi:tRNA U34 5-methylaminomethyl-2-thiouridine-forming methyltransferase MnmC
VTNNEFLTYLRQLITTSDGSHSIFDARLGVTFHSRHGAIQESQHIYIDAGIRPLLNSTPHLRILEIGFGTGLNALLTYIYTLNGPPVEYFAIDNYPLAADEFTQLNYCAQLRRPDLQPAFLRMHNCSWNHAESIDAGFTLEKQQNDIRTFKFQTFYHLVYFDAFDPVTQPDLWTTDIFSNIRGAMHYHANLVTYSSKSTVQKSLRDAGFQVEKRKGPPGKREFIVATAM